jgi:hypothetical protein
VLWFPERRGHGTLSRAAVEAIRGTESSQERSEVAATDEEMVDLTGIEPVTS